MNTAGTMPFERGQVGRTTHVPVQARVPDMPRELAAIVDRMLSFNRSDRPNTAELCADLGWLLDASEIATPVRIRKPRWTPAVMFESQETVPEHVETDPAKHR